MLICLHCGSGMIATTREWVSRYGWATRRRCLKCGRDKIEDTGSNTHGTSPLQTGEKIAKEARMGKSGTCKFEGCTKKTLAGGYCYRHYKVVHGHRYEGGKINHKGGNIEMAGNEEKICVRVKPEVLAERIAQGKVKAPLDSAIPLIRIFLDPELLEKLTAAAKKEYRTPELHAAWILDKELSA